MSYNHEITIKKGNQSSVIMASSLRAWERQGWEQVEEGEEKSKRVTRKKTAAKRASSKTAANRSASKTASE